MKTRQLLCFVPVVSFILGLSLTLLLVQTSFSQSAQPPARVYDEAQTIYLGNLVRRQHGVPPLRWNQQLTEAARWFSWDSVENRPTSYCGHQDTQGHWPDWRARAFGYLGYAGAENAFCGYVTPEQAIEGWLNSPGHRANLLDPNSREIGLGYYLREGDGRGYVTQDFGHDPVYAPVIIESEAIAASSPEVNLYIYDRELEGGFAGQGPAVQMRVGNDPCFLSTAWEPYQAEKSRTLEPGQGWRSVYVQTRDALSRTMLVSDVIYLGPEAPLAELGAAQMSTTQSQVTLYNLAGNELPLVQLSLNWLADDTFETFALLWGNGERVSDAAAWGGTAFRLRPGNGESAAWVWTTEFVKDVPLMAYVRLKVSNNLSPGEVARFSIEGGGAEYGSLSLHGTDFTAANYYQEFPLAFTFHSNPDNPFLTFNFSQSGSADVFVDVVSIFTAPQPVISPLTWMVPGGNYRGQGVWLRYTDDQGHFSPITPADLIPDPKELRVAPASLNFLAVSGVEASTPQELKLWAGCQTVASQAQSNTPWLNWQAMEDGLQVSVNPMGLSKGTYQGRLTVRATGVENGLPVVVPVTLTVEADRTYLPLVMARK